MPKLECVNCDSPRVKTLACFGATTIFSCGDCGFKFSDSDSEFHEELKTDKMRRRVTEDNDDESYA